jgi:hypothetical protein
MDAEQLFEEKVMEQNRELDAAPVGVQQPTDDYYVFLVYCRDNAVLLRLDPAQFEKLADYIDSVQGGSQ